MPTLSRRTVLAGLGAVALLRPIGAGACKERLYFSARLDDAGSYFASAFNGAGIMRFDRRLPGRGHSISVRSTAAEVVFVSRRPGNFLAVADLASGQWDRSIEAAEGRFFNGHGIFSSDERWLFATETEVESGAGLVGIYDAHNRYYRAGEISSGGLDPHDVRLMSDGRTLVVANGGLLTHPDVPGVKLNVPTMEPSLTYIDSRTGNVLRTLRLPTDLHQLSIRHLAVAPSGVVGIAMQYEGPSSDLVPLVAIHRPEEDQLQLLAAPDDTVRSLRNYCGSAAVNADGTQLAVSSPVGGTIVFWDLTNCHWLAAANLTDGCGLAATADGDFLMSSGTGALLIGAGKRHLTTLPIAVAGGAHWDNHLVSADL